MRQQNEYAELYDNEAVSTWASSTDRVDWQMISRYVSERTFEGARILDFGCYSGGLLARFDSSYQLYGIEVNRAAAAIASMYARVWPSIQDVPSDLRFEVIVAADVVEHFVDPGELISQLSGLLSDDGLLVITTGDADTELWNRYGADWWYCYFPEHVSFISAEWLSGLTKSMGVDIVCCDTFRYVDHSAARRLVDRIAVHCYGRFPRAFLLLLELLQRLRGREGIKSVPGAGATTDHLFIVLGKGACS